MNELDKTVYFPIVSVLLITLLSVYLAAKFDQRNFHFILFYYGTAAIYGYGAFERKYAEKTLISV